MRLQFVGCGDAFGSGGRFNTCFHLTGARTNVLVDCGASSLPALQRLGVDRNAIDAILFTHFHGDHFGGLPFFMLDARFVSKRERPLILAGPPGLRGWYERALEAAFPGSAGVTDRFPLSFTEIAPGETGEIGALRATAFHVRHDDRAGPCLAYRIEAEGKVIAYSGDTEWVDTLIEAGRDADLFVCECYVRDKPVKSHLSLSILNERLPEIRPKRLILTHMSRDMLDHIADVPHATAEDGMVVEI
jgi:ribonuclease BN (tRNA processing enzyme)